MRIGMTRADAIVWLHRAEVPFRAGAELSELLELVELVKGERRTLARELERLQAVEIRKLEEKGEIVR